MTKARTPRPSEDELARKLGLIERLVTFVGSNFFKTIQTLVVLLLAVLVFGVYKQIELGKTLQEIIPFVAPTPEKETENFHNSIGKSMRVHEALESARDEIRADRLVLAEFHNNKRNLNAVPWNFTTARDAALAAGIGFELKDNESVPNTLNAEYYAEIWAIPREPRCIHKLTAEVHSSFARVRLEKRGTVEFVMCPIQNRDGVPIGIVVADYLQRTQAPDPQAVIPVVRNLAAELAPILGKED